MFGLGTGELFLILVIVLVIFGAGKLPEIGSALGRGIRSFKQEMHGQSGPVDKSAQDKPTNDKSKDEETK